MKKRWEAVTVGEIYVDHVFSGLPGWPEPGQEIFTRDYLCELGGGAAITACSLGRLGRRTAAFGVIGESEAAWVGDRMRSFGVETDGLKAIPGIQSGVTVSISVQEERTFFSYAGANEALGDYLMSPEILSELRHATHVHFAVPLERRVAQYLLPELHRAECTVSLDVGWQPGWYRNPANLETCREIDYFLPNEQEARFLTDSRDPEAVLRGLEQLGFTHVVVKMGAKGATLRSTGSTMRVSPLSVSVVDTTGAGDAFDAGLIDALLDGTDEIEMLRRACACGSLSTRAAGALAALPRREELEEIFEQR